MKICILIPVHNEVRTIAQIVEQLLAKGMDTIVVDDGSTDGSGDVARQKGAVVIVNNKKSGKGYSLRRGFDYILKLDYSGVIVMDGDGQHDISDLDVFIQAAEGEQIGIVSGNRMHNSKGMPFVRYVTNRFMSLLISVACGQYIPDTQCGYRYIASEVLKEIEFQCNDFEIETEMLIKASRKGFKIRSVPIKTIYRDEESKINPFKDTIRFIVYFSREVFNPWRKN